MSSTSPNRITLLLNSWQNGDQEALVALIPLIYDELHRLASFYLLSERNNHTLQSTALINELFLRLMQTKEMNWQDRSHFIAIAANTMRRVLVDYSRNRLAKKRGGDFLRITLTGDLEVTSGESIDLIALNDALTSLEVLDSRQSKIVDLSFFGGLTIEEIAQLMNIAPITVRRDLNLAKAWLHRELSHN